ncbi:MAG: DUF2383 domain-containing protein [Verrucomicrobiota bacterium]
MNPISENSDHCISVCNRLLRGELSAVETYAQAIEKYSGSPVAAGLREIRSQHARSATLLSANVREMGGEPEKDSGAWGLFATAVQGAANLFGMGSAIESLQKGEETGLKDYQAALLDEGVMTDCKEMIRENLLPPVLNHIASLEKFEQSV